MPDDLGHTVLTLQIQFALTIIHLTRLDNNLETMLTESKLSCPNHPIKSLPDCIRTSLLTEDPFYQN